MTAKKRLGPLKRQADYDALKKLVAEMEETRKALVAVIQRVNWIEKSLKLEVLHTTQDVSPLIVCQEFVRKG